MSQMAMDIESARRAYAEAIGTPGAEHARDRLLLLIEQARQEYWAERAAIREYDGGMSRAEAERAAWEDVDR